MEGNEALHPTMGGVLIRKKKHPAFDWGPKGLTPLKFPATIGRYKELPKKKWIKNVGPQGKTI